MAWHRGILRLFSEEALAQGYQETGQLQERQGIRSTGMHKVRFARGVSGVDFQGMADHGQMGDNRLGEQQRGKEFCFSVSLWSDIPFSFQSSRLISEAFITI